MSKLFEVNPIERAVFLNIESYKTNRVLTKIVKLLNKDGIFKVVDMNKFCDIDPNEKVYSILVNSDKDKKEILQDFKNEIISYIPDHFPDNYLFNFKEAPFGFIRSFRVDIDDEFSFEVYHKIKEVRTKRRTIIPKNNIKA